MKDKTPKKTPSKKTVLSVAILASRYHSEITSKLAAGAQTTLENIGASAQLYWVPGAYELPQAAQILANSGHVDAIVALGCLIRGETAHFDYIARTAALGLDAVGRSTGVAVSFGVLTVDSLEQAMDRAGGREGNKGEEAAWAAVELALLQKEVSKYGKSKKSARTGTASSLSH